MNWTAQLIQKMTKRFFIYQIVHVYLQKHPLQQKDKGREGVWNRKHERSQE